MQQLIDRLKLDQAELMRGLDENPEEDNRHLKSINIQLSAWTPAADKLERELEEMVRDGCQEPNHEPPPLDPAWTRNDSSNMDASWFTDQLSVDDLLPGPDQGPCFMPLVDAYREGDELWEFSNPASGWYINCVCTGVALVRDGKVIDKVIILTC